jgi:hydrogenase/urease accessory protein HupE
MLQLSRFIGLFGILLLLCGIGVANNAVAHEIRPALLKITEQKDGVVAVTWKLPTLGDSSIALEPVLPKGLVLLSPVVEEILPGALLQRSFYKQNGASLVGETITIRGLTVVQTDVLLQVALADDSYHSAILRPDSPSFLIPQQADKLEVASSYWRMGVFHILEGFDHLLFVFALLLLVSGFKKLLKTITAFTIAHSITLALSALGAISIPSAPTEAVISLSILFLASEIVRMRAGESVLTARYPWSVAFLFGLFHGLGFASALASFGLPQNEVAMAVLMFNVGVETGQILFVVAVLSLLALVTRFNFTPSKGSRRLLPYGIGSIAAFWTIERFVSFF